MTRDKILNFIKTYTKENGYPPTYREMQDHLGVSTGTIIYHLDMLEADGLIERKPRSPRSIRIVEQ